MAEQRKSLRQLFVPIWLETLFFMMAGIVDTLMLSYISDNAVGAIGTANTYISIFIIAFSVITSGMTAVMTQYIGAGKSGVAYQARQLGMIFNVAMGGILSAFMIFGGKALLKGVGISEALFEPAAEYLRIVGGCCFLNALIPVFSGYLRAFGYAKTCLVGTIVGNIINLVLNALFLMVFKWGVKGVAAATVISRIVNLVILVIQSKRLVKAKEDENRIAGRKVLGQIIKIGFPAAMETALYNVAMTLVISMLNKMDDLGFNATARSYAVQIANFSYSAGAALAMANAIVTGWKIGEKRYEECYRATNKAAVIGIGIAIASETVLAFLSQWIMLIFTDDVEMIRVVRILLTIDIVLEIGRVSNLVFGQALKTSGDAVFPVILGAVFMFLCAVGFTYIFGMKLELLVVGAYIGLAADECFRAVGMCLRWRTGRWKKMSLVAK